MKVYEWLTTMAKKSETWMFLLILIWVIGGILLATCYLHDSPDLTIALIVVLFWGIIGFILCDVCLQRADLENWVYFHIRTTWKFREKPISILLYHLGPGLLLGVLLLLVIVVLVCALVLWISGGRDISNFGEDINNYTSVILVFIFIAQTWVFYQQYNHMKQPLFKTPLFWTLSKSNSDTDCCILLKNGGNVPIFNISYRILEVLVKDRWGYKGYKKVKSEEISKDFLPRLDGGSEKEIFENPAEEFKEMRLAVYLSAKTLDGHSTRLFFYKAPGAMDFRLAGSIHA